MGPVASVLTPLALAVPGILSAFFPGSPNAENATLRQLRDDRWEAEERERGAWEELRRAQRAAEVREREAQEELRWARRAAEERERETQQERNRARRAAEEREREVREERERMWRGVEEREREAQEERNRARRAAEEREREAREQREQTQRAMQRVVKEAQEKLEQAQETGKKREEEARKRLERVQEDLRNGVEREMIPTGEEIEAAKAGINYKPENLHFAVCGTAGSGKSSLINAIRGVRSGRPGAAKTGITETTTEIGRFPDHHTGVRSRFVWYDVPGAGTLNTPGWQHFNDQGLYVFDFIVIVVDNRVTKIDLEIIKNCQRFKIPTFIVRSKADQHIQNLQNEMGYDDGDGQDASENSRRGGRGGVRIRESPYELARDKYIFETRKSVTENLLRAGLPDQHVYIVCQQAIYKLMSGRDADKLIDEEKLLRDLLSVIIERRFPHQTGPTI